MALSLFGKKASGRLVVRVVYHPRTNFFLQVTIRELKIQEPITADGKVYEVPPGRYTVVLKGLMGDPDHVGSYSAGFREAYGSFERFQEVTVQAGEDTVCSFEFPRQPAVPVTIRIVQDGAPVARADVLVKEADPVAHVTRDGGDTLFHLEPGNYLVVVSHGATLMKEVIRVEPGQEEGTIVLDLAKQVALQVAKVVVRYVNMRMFRGITEDFTPGVPGFTIKDPDGNWIGIEDYAGVKAVFFVKTLHGDPDYEEKKTFENVSQFGRRTVVIFHDGERMMGYTLFGDTEEPQFFLFPADPQSNNDKVYINREAVEAIQFVQSKADAGGPRRPGTGIAGKGRLHVVEK
jgi:hypothetical protein